MEISTNSLTIVDDFINFKIRPVKLAWSRGAIPSAKLISSRVRDRTESSFKFKVLRIPFGP